jgi:hypothetical protein
MHASKTECNADAENLILDAWRSLSGFFDNDKIDVVSILILWMSVFV